VTTPRHKREARGTLSGADARPAGKSPARLGRPRGGNSAGHNSKSWFDANRQRYEAAYLDPAKAFVDAIGPQLRELVPGISTEARVNGSIFRINRDTRFSKDNSRSPVTRIAS